MSPKSRADYFKQRRDALKSISVMVEREALDELDSVLKEEEITRTKWIQNVIYDKIGYKKEGEFSMPSIIYAECPKCGKKAHSKEELEKFFGWRTVNGKVIPQSWCKECR